MGQTGEGEGRLGAVGSGSPPWRQVGVNDVRSHRGARVQVFRLVIFLLHLGVLKMSMINLAALL